MSQQPAVLLTNFLPPYRIPFVREWLKHEPDLRILLSAKSESDREWTVSLDNLPVTIQKSFRWKKRWHHRNAFSDAVTLHFPYDTLTKLQELSPRVVVSSEFGARTLQAALYRLIYRDSRLVIWATVSEITEANRGAVRWLLRRALARIADAVIVNGGSGARYVRSLGIEPSAVFLAPQTTNLDRFLSVMRSPKHDRVTRLLYCGRLIELKGLLPFLDRLRTWAANHPKVQLHFRLVGGGDQRQSLESYSVPPNLCLEFTGHVEYDQLPEIYADADLFVFPSLADEWGLAVVEALASGLPILGSIYSQAVEELVQNGLNGWVFTPASSESLDACFDAAFNMSLDSLAYMETEARNSVRHLTPAMMAQAVNAALDYVTDSRTKRSQLL